MIYVPLGIALGMGAAIWLVAYGLSFVSASWLLSQWWGFPAAAMCGIFIALCGVVGAWAGDKLERRTWTR